jgi:hypothetical protein
VELQFHRQRFSRTRLGAQRIDQTRIHALIDQPRAPTARNHFAQLLRLLIRRHTSLPFPSATDLTAVRDVSIQHARDRRSNYFNGVIII